MTTITHQYEWDTPQSQLARSYKGLLNLLETHEEHCVRISVEVGIPTCCDKYIGQTVAITSGLLGAMIINGRVAFCPECGKKLEEA